MTSNQVKTSRLKLGLTQRELEKYLGLKPNNGRTIRRWESGEVSITGPCRKLILIYLKHGLDL